ncbi:MAG TPA: hypothetical protein VFD35_14635 [Pricia sp.]|nr:hypothetical protein [Pricia sp.]
MNYQLSGNYGVALENGGYFNMNGLYLQAERTIRPNISDATKKECLVEGHPIYFRKQKFYFNTSLTLSAAS